MGDAADDILSGNQALEMEVNNYTHGEIDGPDVSPPRAPGFRRGARAAERATQPRKVIAAKFEGDCYECGFSIAIGDPITPITTYGSEESWVHERCAR